MKELKDILDMAKSLVSRIENCMSKESYKEEGESEESSEESSDNSEGKEDLGAIAKMVFKKGA